MCVIAASRKETNDRTESANAIRHKMRMFARGLYSRMQIFATTAPQAKSLLIPWVFNVPWLCEFMNLFIHSSSSLSLSALIDLQATIHQNCQKVYFPDGKTVSWIASQGGSTSTLFEVGLGGNSIIKCLPRCSNTDGVSEYWSMASGCRPSDRKCDCCSMHWPVRRSRTLPWNPFASAPPSCLATSGSIASRTAKGAEWGCYWTYQFYSPQFRLLHTMFLKRREKLSNSIGSLFPLLVGS